jgi:O-acetyl-ADP-ribose deacetylase (regulator of RNase III)
MTIMYAHGNILLDGSQAIVIPVNTVGVPGAGLAKAWAQMDPVAAGEYKALCKQGRIKIGEVAIVKHGESRWVMFPTKDHWRNPSHLEWIEAGLVDLQRYAPGFQSLAIPALGCGLGGLKWEDVKRLMETYLSQIGIPVSVYPPKQ